jgi:hypothetical protein
MNKRLDFNGIFGADFCSIAELVFAAAGCRRINSMEVPMISIRIFDIHRTWEDWAAMVLGVVIALSPWPGQPTSVVVFVTDIMWNATLVGILVCALGAVELVDLHRWEQVGEIACGAWLIASPYIFGYAGAGMLQYWHFGLGAAVALLAVVELWQDWNLSDQQLARHGSE